MYMIPDESFKVRAGKLRYKYESIEALKKEVNNFLLELLNTIVHNNLFKLLAT
jgi:hypothetical protein